VEPEISRPAGTIYRFPTTVIDETTFSSSRPVIGTPGGRNETASTEPIPSSVNVSAFNTAEAEEFIVYEDENSRRYENVQKKGAIRKSKNSGSKKSPKDESD